MTNKYPNLTNNSDELEGALENSWELYEKIRYSSLPEHIKTLSDRMMTERMMTFTNGCWVPNDELNINVFNDTEGLNQWADTFIELCNEILKIETTPADFGGRNKPEAYYLLYNEDYDRKTYSSLGVCQSLAYCNIQVFVNGLWWTETGFVTPEAANKHYHALGVKTTQDQ